MNGEPVNLDDVFPVTVDEHEVSNARRGLKYHRALRTLDDQLVAACDERVTLIPEHTVISVQVDPHTLCHRRKCFR